MQGGRGLDRAQRTRTHPGGSLLAERAGWVNEWALGLMPVKFRWQAPLSICLVVSAISTVRKKTMGPLADFPVQVVPIGMHSSSHHE